MQGLINPGPRHQAKGMRLVREEGRDSGVQDVAANKCKERKTCLHSCLGPDSGMPVLKPGLWRTEEEPSFLRASCQVYSQSQTEPSVTGQQEGHWNSPFPWLPWSEATGPPSHQSRGSFLCFLGTGSGTGRPLLCAAISLLSTLAHMQWAWAGVADSEFCEVVL